MLLLHSYTEYLDKILPCRLGWGGGQYQIYQKGTEHPCLYLPCLITEGVNNLSLMEFRFAIAVQHGSANMVIVVLPTQIMAKEIISQH